MLLTSIFFFFLNNLYFQARIQRDARWLQFWESDTVKEKWDVMYNIILDSLDFVLPKRRIRVTVNNPQWFTKDVLNSISLKNRLFKAAKANLNNMETWIEFRAAKRNTRKVIRKSKSKCIQSTLTNSRNDPKRFWNEINKLLGAGKDPSKSIKTIQNDVGDILCDSEAAEYLNDYYVSIGSVLAQDFGDNEWKPDFTFPQIREEKFDFRLITEKECLTLIKQIDINKSSALDNIKTIFIRDAFLSLSFEVAYLLNESLRLSEFPISWGNSMVTPIPKEGNQLDPGNWRPISQMPVIGRLLEKAIHTQLSYYINSTGLLHHNQHGFRTGKSTGSAIFQYTKYLYNALDNDETTTALYIDYKKAFDTICHEILLKKLILYGFTANAVMWFENYLTNRSQSTLVNGHKSEFKSVSCGVPQGSTLGPTLFIIYVNDLFHCRGLEDAGMLMYADDTVIFASDRDPNKTKQTVQKLFDKIIAWCDLNRLTVNEKKTKITFFNHNRTVYPTGRDILCKQKPLEEVSTYKYLGVDIAADLSFDEYVKNVYKKVNYKVYMFSKIRKFITTHAAIMIYKQTITPYLDYASFLMDSAHMYTLSSLDKIHKRCMRLIEYKSKKDREKDITTLMRTYRIQSIRKRRKVQLLSFMYHESRTMSNLNTDRPERILRSRNKVKFKEKFTRKTAVLNSPLYRGFALWNMLHEEVQTSISLPVFKRRIRDIFYS